MSQPIALGGSAPIALGPTNVPSATDNDPKPTENGTNGTEKKSTQAKHHFADEVRIGDETIITIPVEHIFYDEQAAKPKRKSRWAERPDLKKKVHQDVVFNPYQALTGGSHLLPITDGRDPNQIIFGTGIKDDDKNKDKEKKRVSKWGEDWEKTFQPPVYHTLPKSLKIDDVEYLMRLHRLDEITRNLNIGELEIGDADVRSPSPDPAYDKNGVRTNTRINRAKEKMLREKQDLIEECMRLRKAFVPPSDYKPPKKSKKIFLPEGDGSDHNSYIGMVLGPKGATQKALESKTGCKISIRGKGSSKQKRMEIDSDEKLHVFIQAETDDALEKGAEEVEKILRGDTIETTEADKAKQLQVMAIGSALGDDMCTNCGEKGHRSWECPNKASFTRAVVKCAICGDRSHPTSDCPQKKAQGSGLGLQFEYAQFMSSLSGKKPEARISTESTSFFTNTPKPVLALTSGGGNYGAFPSPLFPTIGMSAMSPTLPSAMNMQAMQMPMGTGQPNRQHQQHYNASQLYGQQANSDSGPTRPSAYTIQSTTAGPHFINPMTMSYIPQNLQPGGNQSSGITVTNVNANTPMGMGMMQSGMYMQGMGGMQMMSGAQGMSGIPGMSTLANAMGMQAMPAMPATQGVQTGNNTTTYQQGPVYHGFPGTTIPQNPNAK